LVSTKIKNVSEEAPEVKEVQQPAAIIVASMVGAGFVNGLVEITIATSAMEMDGTATVIGNKAAHLYDKWNTLSPFANYI